jgi:hypothetical protein
VPLAYRVDNFRRNDTKHDRIHGLRLPLWVLTGCPEPGGKSLSKIIPAW